MLKRKSSTKFKFPENRELSAKLLKGDNVIIAGYAGVSLSLINNMMSGNRRITDKVARAIIRLMKEREELNESLQQIINQ